MQVVLELIDPAELHCGAWLVRAGMKDSVCRRVQMWPGRLGARVGTMRNAEEGGQTGRRGLVVARGAVVGSLMRALGHAEAGEGDRPAGGPGMHSQRGRFHQRPRNSGWAKLAPQQRHVARSHIAIIIIVVP